MSTLADQWVGQQKMRPRIVAAVADAVVVEIVSVGLIARMIGSTCFV